MKDHNTIIKWVGFKLSHLVEFSYLYTTQTRHANLNRHPSLVDIWCNLISVERGFFISLCTPTYLQIKDLESNLVYTQKKKPSLASWPSSQKPSSLSKKHRLKSYYVCVWEALHLCICVFYWKNVDHTALFMDPQSYLNTNFSMNLSAIVLFTHLKIILLQCFQ